MMQTPGEAAGVKAAEFGECASQDGQTSGV